MANIPIEVNTGQTKTITFHTADTFSTEDITFSITAAGGDANTTLSGFAYCETAAATAAKTATMPGFELVTGQRIILQTTVANSATSNVTLSVNGTAAKPIKIGTANPTGSNFPASWWIANYNGTNWVLTRVYLSDTDTKVTQTITTSSNSSWRPLILGSSYSDAATFSPATTTNTTYATHLAKFKPSTGVLGIVGLNKMTTSGTVTTGSDSALWNTNGGTTTIATVATSGSYNDLSNKPTIPTKTSELTNDSDFLTSSSTLNATKLSGTIPAGCYTDNDTKVTSADNHYAPATVSGQDKTASASGASAAWSIDVVKGVTLNTDGKGHVTGISVTSGKIPGNPNTNTTLSGVAYCDTAAGTKAKTATMPGFALSNGQRILLYLVNSSTIAGATLSVNGTTAKNVYIGGAAATASNFTSGWWIFNYNNTNWVGEKVYLTDTDVKVTPVALSTTGTTDYNILLVNNSSTPTTNGKPNYATTAKINGKGEITASKFKLTSGNGFLMADGSVDDSVYALESHGHDGVYQPSGNYKTTQAAVSDPATDLAGATAFIDTITQDTNGVITATKKSLPSASSSVAGITKVGASGGAAAYDHTHSGYLTSSSTLDATKLSGTIPSSCYTDNNTTLSGVAYCSSGATANKTADLPGFALSSGQRILLYLATANTKASATLSINSTTAKTVRIGSSAVTASNWTAGYWLMHYDGTYWNATQFAVSQEATTTSNYRKILLSSWSGSADAAVTATPGIPYQARYVEVQPSTGYIRAKAFVKGGATTNNILLAGGGDIAQSTFATASHSHDNYLTSVSLVASDSASGVANVASSSTVFLNSIKVDSGGNNTVMSSNKITGSGTVTVSSDGYGNITIAGTGGGSTVTVPSSNITLSTTAADYITVDGTTRKIGLPSTIPSSWIGTTATTVSKGNHGHGPITNGGYILGNTSQAGGVAENQVLIANGDRIVIGDYSDRSGAYHKLKLTSIVFDGSTTTKFLSQKGTWETPAGGGGGSTVTLPSDNITLSTTAADYITVDGTTRKIGLPTNAPTSWMGTTQTTFAKGDHLHGNIQSTGALQTTDVTIASGDKLVVTDSSDSNKIARTSLAFGTSTTTFLRNDGTWATPAGGGGGSVVTLPTNHIELSTTETDYITVDNVSRTICLPSSIPSTWLGSTATDAASGTHTHSTKIETSTGTSQISLTHGSKYALTAGGTSYIFTMPSAQTTITLSTGSSWTSSDRVVPFSASGNYTIQYVYNDSSKGLTFNPASGALKAGSFVKRNPGAATNILLADGSDRQQIASANSTIGMVMPVDNLTNNTSSIAGAESYTLDTDSSSVKILRAKPDEREAIKFLLPICMDSAGRLYLPITEAFATELMNWDFSDE